MIKMKKKQQSSKYMLIIRRETNASIHLDLSSDRVIGHRGQRIAYIRHKMVFVIIFCSNTLPNEADYDWTC